MKSKILKLTMILLVFLCRMGMSASDTRECYCETLDGTDGYTRFENYTQANAIGDDGSVLNLIELPFEFRLMSVPIHSFYVNINGSISDQPISEFHTIDFQNYNGELFMIAPYWADIHLGSHDPITYKRDEYGNFVLDRFGKKIEIETEYPHECGDIFYKYLKKANGDTVGIKILWYETGFYWGGLECDSTKKNTFELVLTDGNGDFLPMGQNIAFCYKKIGFAIGSASQSNDNSSSSYLGDEVGFQQAGTPATVGIVCREGDSRYYYQIGRYDRPGDDEGNRESHGSYYVDKQPTNGCYRTTYSGIETLTNASENCALSYDFRNKYSVNISECQGKGKYKASAFAAVGTNNGNKRYRIVFDGNELGAYEPSVSNSDSYFRYDTIMNGDNRMHTIKFMVDEKIDTSISFIAPYCEFCPEESKITIDGVLVNNAISLCKNKLVHIGYQTGETLINPQYVWSFESETLNENTEPITQFQVMNSGYFAVKITTDNCQKGVVVGVDLNVDICPETACNDCPSKFSPKPGEKYVVGGWVNAPAQLKNSETTSFTGVYIEIRYSDGTSVQCYPKGNIIDGWQRISETIVIPEDASKMTIALKNSSGAKAYFDDIRFHPFNATMKSYVYDPETLRLSAELDDENYATFYDYDEEGALVRVRKETDRGVMTIQEARQSTYKTK